MPRKKRKVGVPPGTPVYTGEKINFSTEWTCYVYNDDQIEEIKDYQSVNSETLNNKVLWLDVRGVHEPSLIEQIALKFNIHPLALEDILDVDQRPKLDEYDDNIFITLLALKLDKETGLLIKEQVTLYFGPNFLISFQEDADDFLAAIRERLLNKRGRVRQRGSDYLAYSIIDFVVDYYYDALDYIEKKLSEIDEKLHLKESIISKEELHDLKIQIIRIRKSIYPMREVINRFIRTENQIINKSTDVYLRDLADHSIQIADMSETYQDMLNSLHDLYQTEISNRMNNVMKILTIISTIFIPLTFIVGIYGMNFKHMPELETKNGYYMVLLAMFIIAISFLIYFKKKKWI